jgi:sugar lactone lactonase YvrE
VWWRKVIVPAQQTIQQTAVCNHSDGCMRTAYRSLGGLVAGLVLLAWSTQAQNLFVSAQVGLTSSGGIYELSPAGVQSTFVSGLRLPSGLAFDSAGDLFAVVALNGEIVKISPSGGPSTIATGLRSPTGLAVNSAGDLFVAVSQNGTVVKISSNGTQSTYATGLNVPSGLAFDRAGNLFVSSIGDGTITEITGSGQSTFVSGLSTPRGLAFDGVGNLFEADEGSGNIYEFTNNNGTLSSNLNVFVSGLSANGLAFNNAGELFAAGANEILEISPNGAVSVFASGPSGDSQLAFQPVPVLQAAATNGAFQVTVKMPSPYYTTMIQASTDLVNWFNIYTNTPPFTFTDSTALSCRYYRALQDTNSY